MNKFHSFLILLCSLVCISASVSAAEQKKIILGHDELQEIFTDIMGAHLPDHVEEIHVTHFSSTPGTITVPEGKISYHSTRKTSSLSPGKKFVSVVLSVNNQEQATFKMYGDIHFWGTVISAAHSISKRTLLDEDNLVTEFRDISMLGDNIIADVDEAIGKELKKSLRAGAVLYSHFLKNPPLVKRGDLVTILATTNSLRITVPGEIKNTGGLGDIVRVKNMMSRRTLQAKVIDEGLVEVQL